MVSTKNPFPGMNPFLERIWHPVHTKLISYIDDEIAAWLPEDLVTRPEERLVIDEVEPRKSPRADVGITEVWKQGVSPSWVPETKTVGDGIAIAEPQIVRVDEDVERWIEIRTTEGRVVTVIELLSPANKEHDRERYKHKQASYLSSTTSVVEIDLLRDGRLTMPISLRDLQKSPGTCYWIWAGRAWHPGTREVYCCPLRERLPAIRIPLRPQDRDLVLDLQPLINRCYELGRYYKERFDVVPGPPLPPDEAEWVDERLRAAGLRS